TGSTDNRDGHARDAFLLRDSRHNGAWRGGLRRVSESGEGRAGPVPVSTDSAHNAARRGGDAGTLWGAWSRAGRCALKRNSPDEINCEYDPKRAPSDSTRSNGSGCMGSLSNTRRIL